jgi:hypothetical protein
MKKIQLTKSVFLKSPVSKLSISLASALLILGLAISPVQASHYRDVIAPLATVAALTYLLSHGYHHSTLKRRSYRSYGYRNNVQRHRYRYQQQSRRQHSHSSSGYSHKSNKHYQH